MLWRVGATCIAPPASNAVEDGGNPVPRRDGATGGGGARASGGAGLRVLAGARGRMRHAFCAMEPRKHGRRCGGANGRDDSG